MKMYRLFREPAHAHQFLAGEVRFGNLDYYRALETGGPRQDPTEGQAHHTEFRTDRTAVSISGAEAREVSSPGVVSVRTECGNDVFVYCLTQPPGEAALERAREDLGDVVVEVDADRLLADVITALDSDDPWQRGSVMLWPVEYTKGLERAPSSREERSNMAVRLAVTQKPPAYAHQYEHRIALISFGTWQEDGPPPDFLTVRIPHRLDYARVVSVSIARAK